MFERWFAKYARAVSDEGERRSLYKKYVAKIIALIVFYVLCAAVLVGMIALENYLNESWALYTFTALLCAWIISGIVALILGLSFRRAYREILARPAYSGEMPEVASYRQKVVQDKKSTFRKLWWAWLVFGICAVAFISLITVEAIKNPEGEEMGVFGSVGTLVLLAGVLTLFFAYLIDALLKQQKGKAIEQQTAPEAEAIDRAQGRKIKYELQADVNAQVEKMYVYLFPNEDLRERAHAERKRRTKIMTPIIIILGVMSIAALVVFLRFGLMGYPLPVMFTLLLGGTALLSACTGGKLKSIESEQKRELESKPEYSKHLEWYNLNYNSQKKISKIYYICLIFAIALGWVLGVLFPYDAWSLFAFLPILIFIAVNNKMVKDMRQKVIPIEKEIDAERLTPQDVRFTVQEGEADENVRIYYDGDSLMYEGEESGITLYLGETLYCMDIDDADCRAAGFSSGQMYIDELPYAEVPAPQNVRGGKLTALLNHKLANGTCWRICFEGGGAYDPESKIILIGNIGGELPVYRIFRNCYVQLSEDGKLIGILCTDIYGEVQNEEPHK